MNDKSKTDSLTNFIKLYFLRNYVMPSLLNSLIEELVNGPRLRNVDGYENLSTATRKYIHNAVSIHFNTNSSI